MSDANVNITTSIEDGDIVSYRDIPYAVLDDDISGTLREDFFHELGKIKKFYQIYKKGMDFVTDGSNGDYVPSQLRFKKAAVLINKEARFMFSTPIDFYVNQDQNETDEQKANNTILNNFLHSNRLRIFVPEKIKKRSKCSASPQRSCFLQQRPHSIATPRILQSP